MDDFFSIIQCWLWQKYSHFVQTTTSNVKIYWTRAHSLEMDTRHSTTTKIKMNEKRMENSFFFYSYFVSANEIILNPVYLLVWERNSIDGETKEEEKQMRNFDCRKTNDRHELISPMTNPCKYKIPIYTDKHSASICFGLHCKKILYFEYFFFTLQNVRMCNGRSGQSLHVQLVL